jgi:tetratricopeptide (TPR) repeat protein
MILRLLSIVLVIIVFAASAFAESAVQCEFSVFCSDSASTGRGELVYRDTAVVVKGIRTTGFMGNFSLDIQFEQVDTSACTFSVHVVTLGPSAYTTSRRFTSEFGLPARLDRIPVKENAVFNLSIKPLKKTSVDTAGCGFLHYRSADFRFDPSANIDIYFVPKTHGDYYWNAVKTMVEDRYRKFADANRFSLPGKYLLYLCPCTIQSVLWDKRFGTMVDPAHNATFALFDKGFNGADPFLILLASIFRNYGYAPPFMAEGYAGYLSFGIYDMKKLAKAGKAVPIESLLNAESFYRADAHVADAVSSTFIRYLIDEYKIDRFLTAYKKASDLNLKETLESVYGKPLTQLEAEWKTYVDSSRIRQDQFGYWAGQADLMNNYPAMMEYRDGQLATSTRREDSTEVLKEAARAHFFNGDYAGAVDLQRMLVKLVDTLAQNWMSLGSYQLMLGRSDSALADLNQARVIDTSDQLVVFNLALCYHVKGEDQKAIDLLTQYTTVNGKSPAIPEARLLLADLLRKTGNVADEGMAREYYQQAKVMYSSFTSGTLIQSSALLWTGVAQLGLGDTGSATDYLSMALYLETRPFYAGMIDLWLGKAADVRGERNVAREYYRKVLNESAAEYHQAEAKKFLEHPYAR